MFSRARKLLQSYNTPKILYKRIDEVPTHKKPGKLDCYVAGFPCQSFSTIGNMEGPDDPSGRGKLIWDIVEYLNKKCPKMFILENVSGLLTFREFFADVIESLRSANDGGYEVHWHMMNTSNYTNLPHNRPRVFIIGLLKKEMHSEFAFPAPVADSKKRSLGDILKMGKMGKPANRKVVMPKLHKTAQANILAAIKAKGTLQALSGKTSDVIVDTGSSVPKWRVDCAPCLTATRAGARAFFSLRHLRHLDCDDMMRLQGVSPKQHFPKWQSVLSDHQMGKIIGNSITLPLLQALMHAGFKSMGFKLLKDKS